jgi:multiple sugar transport system substrate-binding protein
MDKLSTNQGCIGCRRSTWGDADVNSRVPFYERLESLHRSTRELPRLTYWPAIAAIIDRMLMTALDTNRPIEEVVHAAAIEMRGLQRPAVSLH